MRILVFSDTHLTDQFEEKKFNFLKNIISKVDQVIVNGDFWDGYFITFDHFVNSSWKLLFPLLKTKKTVYIFGNHDKKKFLHKKTCLFSDVQSARYELKLNGSSFIFEHGNRIMPLRDETLGAQFRALGRVLDGIEEVMTRSPGKTILNHYCQSLNNKIKKRVKKELLPQHVFVCGHTHHGEIDEKNQFINTGRIRFGLGQYILIEEGNIRLIEEKYD